MKPENAEEISTPADLVECSAEYALERIVAEIGAPKKAILTINKDNYLDAALVSAKLWLKTHWNCSIEFDQKYDLDEWSLRGVRGNKSHCVWSPGA